MTEAVLETPGGGGGTPPPEAVATPAPPVHFNPDGSFAEGWTAGLGDEFSPHADALKDFKDVKGLAKSYLHFRKTGPAFPGEASQPEDIARFHALAQVPVEGTPTAYGLTLPEGASDLDKTVLERITAIAQKNHASAPAVRAMVSEYQAIQTEVDKDYQQQIANQEKARQDYLVEKYRGNYEMEMSTFRHHANNVLNEIGVEADDPARAELMKNTIFTEVVLNYAKRSAEDGIRTPHGTGDLRSDAEKATAIMDGSDPAWGKKYKDGTDDEKREAYKVVSRLLGTASAS